MASILIIDDDVGLLSRLGSQLEQAGHNVVKSSDLIHAEQLYAEQRPDLVLLEVRMGDNAGWELLGRLAAETPVVVLSGAGHEEDIVRGFSEGAVDYVTKPYRSEEFLARLRVRLALAAKPTALAPVLATEPPPASSAPPRLDDAVPRRRSSRRDDPNDEAVFMSEAEEMALLRMPPVEGAQTARPGPHPVDPTASAEGLGVRLRAERQRRHLTLVQIENELKIRMSYLQALEDEKFTLLPRGPVALQMVRQYADFLGLDAAGLSNEFRQQHYVEPTDPLPALGGSRLPRNLPRWAVIMAAVIMALAVAAGAIYAFDPGFFAQDLPTFFQGLWQQILGWLPTG